MIRLERRPVPSRTVVWLTPVLALVLTMLSGLVLFAALGQDPLKATGLIFLSPFADAYSLSEMMVKAAPLILIAVGLSLGFRAEVWNIGAEGQFTIGAICASAVALAFYDQSGFWLLPLMCLRRACRRDGLGRCTGIPQDPLRRQRDSGQPDAGLCRHTAAQRSGHRPPARSGWVQFPGKPHLSRQRNPAEADRRRAGPYRVPYCAHRSTDRVDPARSSCHRVPDPADRRLTQSGTLRRVRRAPGHLVLPDGFRWTGGPGRRVRGYPGRSSNWCPACRSATASRPSSWPSSVG